MTERCSTCQRVLLHVAGELRCCNVHCTTGHATLSVAQATIPTCPTHPEHNEEAGT